MHTLLLAVCVCLVPMCPRPSQAEDGKKKAELEWAQGSGRRLPGLAEQRRREGRTRGCSPPSMRSRSRGKDRPVTTSISCTPRPTRRQSRIWRIAPDRDEVRLTGRLESSHGEVVWTSAFMSPVVKEKESGQWPSGSYWSGNPCRKRSSPRNECRRCLTRRAPDPRNGSLWGVRSMRIGRMGSQATLGMGTATMERATVKAPRRRLSLSLRESMLLVLGLGLWLGWQARLAREQREAVAAIEEYGGFVRFDWEFVDGKPVTGAARGPAG